VRTVILVPRRDDGGERDQLWAWCRRRWEQYHPDYPVVEGHHTVGPFNRSAALNRAARAAGAWDQAIVIDSDVFLRVSQVEAAVALAAKSGRVTWAHRRWRGISQDWTRRLVKDRRDFGPEVVDRTDMDVLVERTNPISWSCCIVFPRAVWDDMGGFDERFSGWGYEDMAVQSVVAGLYGHERIEGDVYHLWHPRSLGSGRADKDHGDYTAAALTNARLGRRYMVALRRDHGLHDRPGLPASDEERERDIANLVRDDAQLALQAERAGLPDWSDYWPTLPELLEGAKAAAAGSVTVVVHSGGKPESWPARREYLAASIESLAAQVSGPIVQRVVYDCWGDAAVRAQLEAMAKPYGFYVVGPAAPVDFTEGMKAMWGYLRKRAKGDYVFQTEDDFVYERPVDLRQLIAALADDEGLAQMALLRDACYPDERETGGILGWPMPAFTFREGWFEHRQFFTLNPSLFRSSLTRHPWPGGRHSETTFGRQLFNDKRVRAAFWGAGEEWVRHIGVVRAGEGY